MSLRTLPGRPRSRRQRVTLTLSAAVLPLALTACGSASATTGSASSDDSPSASIGAAYDNLMEAKSATFTMSLEDPDGSLEQAATEAEDGVSQGVADALLDGSVSFTIDPTGDLTLGDLQDADPGASVEDSLSTVNYAMAVRTGEDDVLGIRLVDGVLFAKVDLDTVDRLAEDAGSDPVSPMLDQAGALSPELADVVTDVKAGQWLQLDLAPFTGQLEGLAGSTGAGDLPQLDGQQLAADLLAAVEPFTEVTGGDDGVYDVEVQARGAVLAGAQVLSDAFGDLGGGLGLPSDELTDPDLEGLRDGPLTATVELDGDSLSRLTLDLSSLVDVAPAGEDVPDLTGARLVLDVADDADEVSEPDDVSDVDLGALVQTVLGSFMGAGTPS